LSALNVLPATVVAVAGGSPTGGGADDRSPIVEMQLDCGGETLVARLTRRSVETLGLVPGRAVFAVIKSVAFDPHTRARGAPANAGADADTSD
jgi:molybdate transport system ATP-binding protein